ncbi:PAP2 family protein, partial [Streptococcus agalactiae 515]
MLRALKEDFFLTLTSLKNQFWVYIGTGILIQTLVAYLVKGILSFIFRRRKSPQLIILLNFLLKIVTGMMYILYPSFLIFTLWQGMTFQLWLRLLIIPAVGFIALSYIRKRLDFPRPYEKWNIKPLIYKDTEGRSMPSRHVFSATMISMCLLRYYVYFGIVC